MKLPSEEIERIIDRLLLEWKKSQQVHFSVPESKVRERLIAIFTTDLQVEDDLNKEVETILEKYEKQFARGELDRRKMFNMVKNQLIKERRLVI